MKVLILCGGYGTRLREHTETLPKPMVAIGGRPILWHIMKGYAHHGFSEFVLCLGYLGDKIKEYFLNYEAMNSDFTVELGKKDAIELHGATHQEDGWKVTLAETGQDAMTGARVKRASRYLGADDATFCVTYGDGVADVDLRAAYAFHRAHGGLATVTGVRPPSRFGELQLDGTRVTSFSEKPQVSEGLINGGFFFFERGFLDYVSEDASCVLEREPLERVAREGQLHVYEHTGFWQCMDTYREWQGLERRWRDGSAPWAVWKA
ncbi:MAG: glucose-1-phosphate cytidylyltransferase [Planctomycetota bacterium]|nr:MAG: glucose-1-phosphate cytidylyltransferase [Planctomycetota bacterium]